MSVYVTHWNGFIVVDEGFPRGKLASLPGTGIIITAEFDECIEDKIDHWWVDHGQAAVEDSIAATDRAIAEADRLSLAAVKSLERV